MLVADTYATISKSEKAKEVLKLIKEFQEITQNQIRVLMSDYATNERGKEQILEVISREKQNL